MNKKKKPKFYCDACGAEVGASATRCTRCGKFFSAVRCPKCFWVGEQEDFKNGCPSCGYSSKGKIKKNISAKGSKKNNGSVELPSWFFAIAASLFVMLIALLLFTVSK
ncbi:hypothetical protein FACS1894102_4090 [Spirochaetia bacterium]|nr:hypothetical protein FACS1894102_4090 [Spirochaetia bacterium]